jgi:hypothetical protein
MLTYLTIAAMLIAGPAWADQNPLEREIWRTRPLVIVAPGPGDDAVAELRQALAQPATASAFADRQIAVFTVIGGQGAREGQALDAAATRALLAALDLRADGPAAVLLIGKDGGVKLRLKHVAVAEILDTVDAMPMRRQEVRRP